MKHMYLLVLRDREDNKLRWVILDLQEQKIYDKNFDLKESDLTYDNCIAYISEDDSIEKLLKNIENGDAPFDRQQALTLDFYRQRIEALEKKVEILKDKVAQIKFSNGAH